MALTKRQKQVLDFIAEFVEKHEYSPSYDEIAKGMNLASLATVHKHISALDAKQYLTRGANQSRSIELGAKYGKARRQRREEVPLAGRIAAGAPVEADEQRRTLKFSDFTGNAETFALEVRGDSMIGDHICDGDFVLLEKTAEARDGEIVAALVEGYETTLKRFYRDTEGLARLQPSNPEMGPIIAPLKDVQIQGRLLAVLRKYR